MLKLRKNNDFETANYHGFTVKKGFWYGINMEDNTPIATSGWECNGCLGVYFKEGNDWNLYWMDIDETNFDLGELPKVDMTQKMDFYQWLEKEQGIEYHDFDENYGQVEADELWNEYTYYLYDGLPQFVQKYL